MNDSWEREYYPGECKEVPINLEDKSIDLTLPTEVEKHENRKYKCDCVIYNPQCHDCTYLRRAEERDERYAQNPQKKPRPKPKPETPETAWEDVDVKKEEAEEIVDLTSDD